MRITTSLLLVLFTGMVLWNGCCFMTDVAEFAAPAGDPNDTIIISKYDNVKIRESNSVDVVRTIQIPKYELLSQSKSVVAAGGVKKRGHQVWFNMVAFEEEGMKALRKYYVMVDERPKVLFVEPWEMMRFNCKMVLDKAVLDKPYANENAKRIEILKNVLKVYRKDMGEIERDNKVIALRGMMVNQAFETLLVKLNDEPALAAWLDRPEGVEFDHINLDKGRIRMRTTGDVTEIKMRLGMLAKKVKWSKDVNDY